ncbi:YbaB/EbfC family nucleoid-associated protein, partial [Staphylococcus pseudintermedius]
MRGGGNMQQMMKQMQKMQKKMAEEQEKLKEEHVEGTAGGGMVKV